MAETAPVSDDDGPGLTGMPDGPAHRPPHRAPSPEDRLRDAERSRRLLLEAALDEFAAKGFSGARTAEIAARAGVNRQLISYYFGGKEGLYRELQQRWLDREAELSALDLPLAEAVVRHLHEVLADPRLLRLGIWRGLLDSPLEDEGGQEGGADLYLTRSRQSHGELAPDLDPAAVMLFMIGAVAIPVAMPQLVRDIFGLDPADQEFEARYAAQLRQVIRRLSLPPPAAGPGRGEG